MAQVFYVSMLGDSKIHPFMYCQITKVFPTWLGCKRVLNRLRRSHPSLRFRMDYVSCYLHNKERVLKQYSYFVDFDKAFKQLYQ